MCDAAIQLLADEGAKGLSHPKVDRYAEVPNGSTSFYFRTRSALLHATAQRVAELDLADLTAVIDGAGTAAGLMPSNASPLATMVMLSADGPHLSRTRARFELILAATRDPALGDIFRHNNDVYKELHRREIVNRSWHGTEPDPDVLDEQTAATMNFVAGVHIGAIAGDRSIHSAEQLDRLLTGIADGVAGAFRRS